MFRVIAGAVAATALSCLAVAGARGQERAPPPPWAYARIDPGVKPPANDGIKMAVPGSSAAFTRTQLFDLFAANDWFPGDHPVMPEVVVHGRKPDVRACGMCHLPNGQGRPESAALAGLPASYIERQVADYKSGRRRSAAADLRPHTLMLETVVHADEGEIKAAAAYFSSLTYRPWIRVEETGLVPKSEVVWGSMWAARAGAPMEPIGQRIVELPVDLERAELRDPRSGFIAYVPVGSIAKGAALAAATRGDLAPPCATCHGPELRGIDPAPPIAGRATSYIVRQLFDIQSGARAGEAADLMKPVVAGMTMADMIAVAAYVASRAP